MNANSNMKTSSKTDQSPEKGCLFKHDDYCGRRQGYKGWRCWYRLDKPKKQCLQRQRPVLGSDIKIGLFTFGVARTVGSTLDPRETVGYAIVKEQGH